MRFIKVQHTKCSIKWKLIGITLFNLLIDKRGRLLFYVFGIKMFRTTLMNVINLQASKQFLKTNGVENISESHIIKTLLRLQAWDVLNRQLKDNF